MKTTDDFEKDWQTFWADTYIAEEQNPQLGVRLTIEAAKKLYLSHRELAERAEQLKNDRESDVEIRADIMYAVEMLDGIATHNTLETNVLHALACATNAIERCLPILNSRTKSEQKI